jgi:hypothetical protein
LDDGAIDELEPHPSEATILTPISIEYAFTVISRQAKPGILILGVEATGWRITAGCGAIVRRRPGAKTYGFES